MNGAPNETWTHSCRFVSRNLHEWVRVTLGAPFIWPCATSKQKLVNYLMFFNERCKVDVDRFGFSNYHQWDIRIVHIAMDVFFLVLLSQQASIAMWSPDDGYWNRNVQRRLYIIINSPTRIIMFFYKLHTVGFWSIYIYIYIYMYIYISLDILNFVCVYRMILEVFKNGWKCFVLTILIFPFHLLNLSL